MELNLRNSAAILDAAQEMIENGQLWIEIDGESIYVPELIQQLKKLQARREECLSLYAQRLPS